MSQTFNRRDLIKNAVVASTVVGATLSAKSSLASESKHHHHAENKNQTAIDAALHCVKSGQLCMDHCIELFKNGDTSVAKCADTVNEMLAMCTALSQMAAYRSSHLKDFAKVCAAVCEDCKKECEKHSDKHVECKDCADSCGDCIDACKNIA